VLFPDGEAHTKCAGKKHSGRMNGFPLVRASAWVKEKMKIGDKVKVVDNGATYSTYTKMAEKLKATRWKPGSTPNNGSNGVIVSMSTHLRDKSTIICLIQVGLNQYIIGTRGLRINNNMTELNILIETLVAELKEQNVE
jgi:hypothetical protein